MPQTITITIPTPVLTANQHFDVKYRMSGAVGWLPAGSQTNAPFTITGLADSDYDISYIMVLADGTRCPERIDHFTIHTAGCPCLTNATGVVEQISANNYQIRVNYTPPLSQPACGWVVTYTDSNYITTQASYSTLPNPLIIPIPINSSYLVTIEADCCGRDQVVCTNLDLAMATTSSCTPASYSDKNIYQVSGQYYLQINISAQSVPATPSFQVNYNQQPNGGTGLLDSGVQNVSPTGTGPNYILTVPISPNISGPLPIVYTVNIKDGCGVTKKL